MWEFDEMVEKRLDGFRCRVSGAFTRIAIGVWYLYDLEGYVKTRCSIQHLY